MQSSGEKLARKRAIGNIAAVCYRPMADEAHQHFPSVNSRGSGRDTPPPIHMQMSSRAYQLFAVGLLSVALGVSFTALAQHLNLVSVT